ncbi:MAG TPA: ABC transporter substrate-binding protein [Vicinamibacterales bacterium]
MRALLIVCALLIAIVPLAGDAQPGLLTLRLGLSLDDDATAVIYAEHAGLFRRAGLHVVFERGGSGAALSAGVLTGRYDIGKAGLVALFDAHLQNAPLVMIAPAGVYDRRAPYAEMVVARGSPIRSPADLDGKRIGAPGAQSLIAVVSSAWVDASGGDSKTLRFVETPLAGSEAALAAKRIDAAIMVNPPMAAALAHGSVRMLGPAMDAVGSRYLFSAWFTSRAWADAHPAVVRSFAEIVAHAATYTNAHPAETAPMVAAETGVPLAVVRRMTRVTNGTKLAVEQIQPLLDLSIRYGLVPRGFFTRDLIYRGLPSPPTARSRS